MARAYDPENSEPKLRLLRNFDDAWQADLALIRELTQQEKQAEEDRALAARLAGIALDEIPDNVRKMAMLLDDYDDNTDEDIKENATQTNQPITITNQTTPRKKCTICMEFVTKKDPCVPCGHAYCLQCLKDLFKTSMLDESLMPPRCCRQEIPIELAELRSKEIEDFNVKRLEYSTIDRLYCSKPTCSTFIPPKSIVNHVGTCPKIQCGAKTCSLCKAANHENEDCPKDEATAAVLKVAHEAGWTRCNKCRAVVELTHGCYHMTCRCRAEFCYLCSIPWKNCSCPQWDEDRLVQEARVRTARIRRTEIPEMNPEIDHGQRLEHMVNRLRANYECRHTNRWIYTPGGGRCEECHTFLRHYLFRCYDCHLMACNRCRRNRL